MPKKKILAIVASPRKKETWAVTETFGRKLQELADVDFRMVFLQDVDIKSCRGCFLCLTKGDEYCPHKDDRDAMVRQMCESDGIVFATPNYSLQVTAIMKNFLDRIAFTFHRPCFFHINAIAIVTQGAIGAEKILGYFKDVMTYTGFTHVKGLALTTVTPRTEKDQAAIDAKIGTAARRFAASLSMQKAPRPSLVQTMVFRMIRSMYRTTPDETMKDVRYYRENGWFESDYYYPVPLGIIRTVLGWLAEKYGAHFALKRKRELGIIPR